MCRAARNPLHDESQQAAFEVMREHVQPGDLVPKQMERLAAADLCARRRYSQRQNNKRRSSKPAHEKAGDELERTSLPMRANWRGEIMLRSLCPKRTSDGSLQAGFEASLMEWRGLLARRGGVSVQR